MAEKMTVDTCELAGCVNFAFCNEDDYFSTNFKNPVNPSSYIYLCVLFRKVLYPWLAEEI